MRFFFTDQNAKRVLAFSLMFVLLLLVATPIRSTIVIFLLMLYSFFYLVLNNSSESKENLGVWGWAVIAILVSFFIGRFGPFVLSGFSGRYISAGIHVAASVPIFLMVRKLINYNYLPSLEKFMFLGLSVGG